MSEPKQFVVTQALEALGLKADEPEKGSGGTESKFTVTPEQAEFLAGKTFFVDFDGNVTMVSG